MAFFFLLFSLFFFFLFFCCATNLACAARSLRIDVTCFSRTKGTNACLEHAQKIIQKKKKSGLEHALIDAGELMHVRGAEGGCDTLVYLKDARDFAHSLMLEDADTVV